MPRLYIATLLAFLFFSACTTSRYYLVRHAERLDKSADSPLSEAGHRRAEALRDSLVGKGIDLIFTSTYLRTKQTAAPLADFLQMEPQLYQPDTLDQFLQRLQGIKGKDVLVVGHSNTTPELVKGLCGDSIAIADYEYGGMFLVEVRKGVFGKKAGLKRWRFGQ